MQSLFSALTQPHAFRPTPQKEGGKQSRFRPTPQKEGGKQCRFRRPFNSNSLGQGCATNTGSACVGNTYPTTALGLKRKVLFFRLDRPIHPGLVHIYLFFLFKDKSTGSRGILSTFHSFSHLQCMHDLTDHRIYIFKISSNHSLKLSTGNVMAL